VLAQWIKLTPDQDSQQAGKFRDPWSTFDRNQDTYAGAPMTDLATRLQRLEDIEALRQLKARYFHACDRKDTATLRDCFVEGPLLIDYGAIGRFGTREAFLTVYEALACHPHIIDMHHGQNAQIDWGSPTEARAVWDLYFFQTNTQTGTFTQLAGSYSDRYEKHDGRWQIAETVFQPTSTLALDTVDDRLRRVLSA
jgi:hypothetical protein